MVGEDEELDYDISDYWTKEDLYRRNRHNTDGILLLDS